MLEHVIFAIDNNNSIHAVAKFTRYLDTLRATNKLDGGVTQCIGHWEGDLEVSYLMRKSDYDHHISGRGWADNQEAVLVVPGDTRQPCTLIMKDGTIHSVGKMVEITKPEGNWTYVPTTGKYFTTVL